MNKYLKLLRVKHYIKNFLVFLPLFFSGRLTQTTDFLHVSGMFFAFSFCASIIYIINDICDIEKDRLHPTKSSRPLASGSVTVTQAYILIVLLAILAVAASAYSAGDKVLAWVCLLLYVLSNVGYSKGLKNIAIVDVFILMLGYVLRLFCGALVVDVSVSGWLYLTVMSMAFYLGLGKRRNESIKYGHETRAVLRAYNVDFLDKNMYACLCMTIVFYSLWCEQMSHNLGSILILLTVPIVVVICMRYSLLVETRADGDPVEVLMKDKALLLLCTFFVMSLFVFVYVLS